ncbi:MAG: hypothetical protein OEX76_05500 [Candidatus Bathyarchaeota archaeon]|nr:hypothetical protein [Candidatus Bathyarchaeota archaeon]MDH5713276.1 hypothetical protein [Candidatus Bathyarchaeota archaeon]
MAEKINLKKIERKAYTSYHQDGLIDVFAGFLILSFGLWLILDMAWMGWILWFVAVSAYAAAKRVVTIPRIGFVKFAPHRAKALVTSALIVLSLFAFLGVVAFMQTEGGGTPLWLLFAIENYMLVIGVSVAASFCVVGYTFRIRRMYAYALLTLIMFVTGHFLYYPLHYYVILLGSLILLFGLAMLVRFIRRYPLSTTRSMGDSGNEGQ